MTLLQIGESTLNLTPVHVVLPMGFVERTQGLIESRDMILDTARTQAIRQQGSACGFRAVQPEEVGQEVQRENIVLRPISGVGGQ